MDDLRIIELHFERDEQAIKETDAKYSKRCHSIAKKKLILGCRMRHLFSCQ